MSFDCSDVLVMRKLVGIKRSCSSNGMTFLEVLIAILLFAVFTATFLMVTEMIGALIPATGKLSAEDDRSCIGEGLEAACINASFDKIISYLEVEPDIKEACYSSLSSLLPAVSGISDLPWPYTYEACIYSYLKSSESGESDAAPGLYLLQAQALTSYRSFSRSPVQRVFCWPYHLCIKQ